jgi:integrase
MGVPEIEAFLSHLAVEGQVSAATQKQALSALLFLYQQVLKQELDGRIDAIRAKRPQYLPTVLTPDEVRSILAQMSGVHLLITQILYGNGLRQTECLSLRIKDLDFQQSQIMVRSGKGSKDRVTPMPRQIVEPLQEQLQIVRRIHVLNQGGRGVRSPLDA